jgi:hypothetical protein
MMMRMRKRTLVLVSNRRHKLLLLNPSQAWVLLLRNKHLIYSEVMMTMRKKIQALKCLQKQPLNFHLLLLLLLRLKPNQISSIKMMMRKRILVLI